MARVSKEFRHEGYVKMREHANLAKGNNDCSIISTALATGISYEESHDLYKSVGRRDGHGVSCIQISSAINKLYKKHKVKSKYYYTEDMKPLYENIHAKTLTFNNIAKVLDKEKKYIIIGVAHMVAFTDGRIADWSEGTKQKVVDIYEILGEEK
jgi:hypothetical protein